MLHKTIGASLQDPRRIIIVDYCLMAFVTALPIYECITSFAREVEIMWSNGFRPKSTIVFYLNRFAMLNMAVMNLLGTLKWHAKAGDEASNIGVLVSALILYGILAVTTAQRVYALSNGKRSKWCLGIVVLLLALVPFCTNIHCQDQYEGDTEGIIMVVTLAGRVCVVTAECVAVLIVAWKTHNIGTQTRRLRSGPLLTSILFRYEIMYFLMLTLLNVIDIVVIAVTANCIIIYFTLSMSSILVSRFMLDLREASQCKISLCASGTASSLDPSPKYSVQEASLVIGRGNEDLSIILEKDDGLSGGVELQIECPNLRDETYV